MAACGSGPPNHGLITGWRILGTLSNPKSLTKPPPWQLKASHCSFAYSALASFRMGMSGSASFQRAKKS